MTTWNEVVQSARTTARALRQKRRPTARYENSHGGAPVMGWRLSSLGTGSDPIVYRGTEYDEVWAQYFLVLGNNGMIYQASLLNTEEGRREQGGFRVTVVKKPSIHLIRPQELHPVQHRRYRYEDIVAALDALAKKPNSDPEPAGLKADKTNNFSPDKPSR